MGMKRWSFLYQMVVFMVHLIMPPESMVKKTTGVLDRFEDNDQAVILMEDCNQEWIVSNAQLPPESNADTWFDIEINMLGWKIITINSQKTIQEKKNAWKVMNKLQNRKQ